MYPPTFDADERKAYLAALNEPTRTRIGVDVLNRDHKLIGSVDGQFDDGQVNFNRGSDVERTLQAALLDLSGDLEQLDMRHMLRVEHSLWVPSLSKWGTVPIICGPVVVAGEDGDKTTFEVHGKESFGLYPGAPVRKWNEGALVRNVIHDMFEDLGETKFRITKGLKARLGNDVVSGGRDEDRCPTRVARRLARQAGYQFFYDSQGYLVLRRPPKVPVVTLTETAESPLSDHIKWTTNYTQIRNTVIGKGKKDLSVRVEAPRDHVFSPRSLRRGGKDQHLKAYLDAEKIGREKELRDACKALLARVLTERSDASATAAPFYHAETHDRVRAEKRNGKWGEFYLTEASIPLGDGDMTIGYQERRRKRSAGRVRIG